MGQEKILNLIAFMYGSPEPVTVGFLANAAGGLRVRVTKRRGLTPDDDADVEMLKAYIDQEGAYKLQGWMDRCFVDLEAQRRAEYLRLKAEFGDEDDGSAAFVRKVAATGDGRAIGSATLQKFIEEARKLAGVNDGAGE